MIVEQIARGLGIPYSYVINLANGASHRYKTYQVKKKSGGLRTIHHPARRLKAAQTWLLQNFLSSLPVHNSAMAYRPKISVFDNAAVHASNSFLLRLDLQDFFPSITADDFRAFASANTGLFAGWTATDLDCVARLLFRKSKLTIGAPSSPALSNALCFEIDARISAVAAGLDVLYTRYADDLFFSCSTPNTLREMESRVKQILLTCPMPANLRINDTKTIHSSKRKNRQVTGITLGSDGKPHIPRHYKRIVRSMVHRFASLSDQEKVSLTGMISYVVGHEPSFTNSLINKYGFETFEHITQLLPLEERQGIHAKRKRP